MRSVIYLRNDSDLELAQRSGVTEVIIAPKLLSRRGTLSMTEARELAVRARALGIATSLEWDALMTETNFVRLSTELANLAESFNSVRVRDAGAAQWIKQHHPQWAIHLLVEAGHHNLFALKSWVMRLGPQLARLCLSPEVTVATLSKWRQELAPELEVLGLGPLLLFHSGRALLSSLESAPDTEELLAEGVSEESHHKGFILQENHHGTLMFHPKDLGLLERWQDLASAGVDVVRIDHRHLASDASLAELEAFLMDPAFENAVLLRDTWNRKWMRGYFDVNKSDILFPKLKNPHLRQRDGETAGVVLEGKKDGWLAILGKGTGLKLGQEITAIDPKGQAKAQVIYWLKDSAFNPIETLAENEVGFISWFGGAPAQTVLLNN